MEPIEVVIDRANAAAKRSDDLLITAGKALKELKERITDRSSDEGKEWDWNWPAFCLDKITCSYSWAQRLIGYVNSSNPAHAIAADREQAAEGMRRSRERAKGRTKAQAEAAENWQWFREQRARDKAQAGGKADPFYNVNEPPGEEPASDPEADLVLDLWARYLALDKADRKRFDSLWIADQNVRARKAA